MPVWKVNWLFLQAADVRVCETTLLSLSSAVHKAGSDSKSFGVKLLLISRLTWHLFPWRRDFKARHLNGAAHGLTAVHFFFSFFYFLREHEQISFSQKTAARGDIIRWPTGNTLWGFAAQWHELSSLFNGQSVILCMVWLLSMSLCILCSLSHVTQRGGGQQSRNTPTKSKQKCVFLYKSWL